MDKSKLTELINKEEQYSFLATVDGDTPRVRPMASRVYEDRILFSTFTNSNKMKQIEKNNKAEMVWLFPDMSHLRVEGALRVIDDLKVKKGFFDNNKHLAEFFKGENDTNYTLVEINKDNVYYNAGEDYKNIVWK